MKQKERKHPQEALSAKSGGKAPISKNGGKTSKLKMDSVAENMYYMS